MAQNIPFWKSGYETQKLSTFYALSDTLDTSILACKKFHSFEFIK